MKKVQWTAEEDELLLYHYRQGRTARECAVFLEARTGQTRTMPAINNRIVYLSDKSGAITREKKKRGHLMAHPNLAHTKRARGGLKGGFYQRSSRPISLAPLPQPTPEPRP